MGSVIRGPITQIVYYLGNMNICITNYDLAPQFTGGIKRVSSILAKEWNKECSIYFIAISPSNNRVFEIEGFPQFHLPVYQNIISRQNVEYFISFVKEQEIDIILHQHSECESLTELCNIVKKRTGIKLIITRHFAITYKNDILRHSFFNKNKLQKSTIAWLKDSVLFLKFHLIKKRRNIKQDNALFRLLIDNSDKFILLCQKHIKDLEKQLKLRKDEQKKICAINNPIEFNKKEVIKKKNKVLWCGRVEYGAKRIDRMLDIWGIISHKHPEWELIIMGSGDIEYFKTLVKKKDIENTHFTGFCNPYEYYKEGSVICMTSSSEGFPMVLIEALMYGCIPIVYDSFSSLDEIVIDGINGYKIPAFNKRMFTERLEWLMENETERNKMISNCQESVKRFDARIIAKQWIEMFKEISSK